MNNRERMHTGELYDTQDASLIADQTKCLEILYDFNATRPSQGAFRESLQADARGNRNCACHKLRTGKTFVLFPKIHHSPLCTS